MPLEIIIYNMLYLIFLFLISPVLLIVVLFFKKYRTGFLNRLGFIPSGFKAKVKGRENIWLHAASAGEVKCVLPLADELKIKYPSANIIFTTTGINGQRMLKKAAGGIAACYLPFDFYFFMKPLVWLLKPKMLVVAETEYWPSLFYLVKKQRGKIVVVNGRFSKKAVNRYALIRWLIKEVFALTDIFAMRSPEDAAVLLRLKVAPEKIVITGDLKYEKPVVDAEKKKALENSLSSVLRKNVFVAGSVHYKEAGELFTAFKTLKTKIPEVTMILASRFMEEIPSFIEHIEAKGYSYVKRSNPGKVNVDIVILDTFGELSYAYGLGSVAFVGGSLAGNIGGHNLLEPLYLGKPVLFGPYAFNFKDIETEVKLSLVGFLVKDAGDLAVKTAELMNNFGMLKKIEEASVELLLKRKGSLIKTMELL